jgi:hypothetical protein
MRVSNRLQNKEKRSYKSKINFGNVLPMMISINREGSTNSKKKTNKGRKGKGGVNENRVKKIGSKI